MSEMDFYSWQKRLQALHPAFWCGLLKVRKRKGQWRATIHRGVSRIKPSGPRFTAKVDCRAWAEAEKMEDALEVLFQVLSGDMKRAKT